MKARVKTDLRKAAAHRQCQVRLTGICLTEPTCLAHVRLVGISGMGLKAPDALGAHCCDACHKAYDQRGSGPEADAIELDFLRGVIRTQNLLIKEEVVRW